MRIPFGDKFVVTIIKYAVAYNPGITYRYIQEIMKPYTKEYMLPDSVARDARDWANTLQLVGSAKENWQHAKGVLDHV